MKHLKPKNGLAKIKELLDIISSNPTPIDLSECITKLKSVLDSAKNEEIKIALLGSFADGKTSAIAGLMGEVMDDMKIDSDESSDDLIVYRPVNLEKGYVIVDTPGLFGSKEREINGKNVQFSDLTIKYISEAHIVLYVTSAVAPVKESHSELLRKILRDLGKLDTTIFVLNKMDETGANITNEESFNNMATIKKQFLTERLEDIISLTKEEAKQLKVVCIAADPKRKGVQKWLETPDRYLQLSRIGSLQDSLDSIISSKDKNKLRADSYEASLKEVLHTFAYIYISYTKPLRDSIKGFREDFDEIREHLARTKKNLIKTKGELYRQLDNYRKQLMNKIDPCSYEEMGVLLKNDIGVVDKNVTFYVVKAYVEAIFNDCCLTNNSALNMAYENLKGKFEKQDTVLKGIADIGIGAMMNVDNKVVLRARDMFFKNYKFKPYGAIKMAKGIGAAAVVIDGIITAWNYYEKYKREKQLNETKESLTNELSKYFSNLFELMATEEDYLANFAPAYNAMVNVLKEREEYIDQLSESLSSVEALKAKVSRFYGADIEDVEFEDFK